MAALCLVKYLCYFIVLCDLKQIFLDTFYKAAWEQASFSIPLQCAFEPAIFTLFVNKNNISFFKLQLCFTLRRVRHHNPVSVEVTYVFGEVITDTIQSATYNRKLPWTACNPSN